MPTAARHFTLIPSNPPADSADGLRRVKKFSDQIYESIMAHIVDGSLPGG